jgi:hypothetical protein
LKTKRFDFKTTPRGFADIVGAVHRVGRRLVVSEKPSVTIENG